MLPLSMLLFFYVPQSFSQTVHLKRSHSIQASNDSPTTPAPSAITIVAVRVQFQKDDNRFTSGDGTFDAGGLPYLNSSGITIDPLPHDQSYFEAHLEFAKNYFEKVSGGKLMVDFRVLPQVYTLDHPMAFYSPIGKTFSNTPLANLARDTWQKVEREGGFNTAGLDPNRTAFVIFHAGVGRDIELTGTTLDITPQDIPSLYLGQESLKELLDQPSFDGFPINGGSFLVKNSLILPQTLSRRGEDVSGQEFVLQLSINGLLCASIGSYLGLPDLFNTQTGTSGIGRFGLMDGESFFSYRGLFPPEPSAWEKIRLGWQQPFTISLDTSPVPLSATSLHQPGSIGKHAISGTEYFLVENRNRDPQGDGAVLSIRKADGTTVQQHFTNANQTFVNQEDGFTELFEPGVLTDVDDFDWSLPGGKAGDTVLNGGILIWHIDEAVIRQQMQHDAVNANNTRRGVNLEEADGAQDIGRAAGDAFSEEARGTPYDFWWAGNTASVITTSGDTLSFYQNRFGPDTTPDNSSNSGAKSFFEFYDFSDNKAIASFKARTVTSSGIQAVKLPIHTLNSTFFVPPSTILESYPPGLAAYTAQTDSFLIIPSATTTYALRLNGSGNALFDFQQPTSQQPYLGRQLVLATAPASASITLTSWQWNGASWQNSWQTTSDASKGFISSVHGDTLWADFTENRFLAANGSTLPDVSAAVQQSIPIDGRIAKLTPGKLTVAGSSFSTSVSSTSGRLYTGAIQLSDTENGFYLLDDDTFSLIRPDADHPLQPVVHNTTIGWPALVDFDKDGRIDILYVDYDNNLLNARNAAGAVLNYFPVSAPKGTRFTGTPLIADLEGDGEADIFITAEDSLSINLYAYDSKGDIKKGFPLYVGSTEPGILQPIHPLIYQKKVFAISHHGSLKAWKFPSMKEVQWATQYGNEPYNKVTGRLTNTSITPQKTVSVLDKEETYNWPNPADSHTNIRYLLKGKGKAALKIISFDGHIVYNKTFDAAGGVAEEQPVITSGWESGIYIAVLTATVNGKKESKLIKIAVVH